MERHDELKRAQVKYMYLGVHALYRHRVPVACLTFKGFAEHAYESRVMCRQDWCSQRHERKTQCIIIEPCLGVSVVPISA